MIFASASLPGGFPGGLLNCLGGPLRASRGVLGQLETILGRLGCILRRFGDICCGQIPAKLSDHEFPESVWKAFGEHVGENEHEEEEEEEE